MAAHLESVLDRMIDGRISQHYVLLADENRREIFMADIHAEAFHEATEEGWPEIMDDYIADFGRAAIYVVSMSEQGSNTSTVLHINLKSHIYDDEHLFGREFGPSVSRLEQVAATLQNDAARLAANIALTITIDGDLLSTS